MICRLAALRSIEEIARAEDYFPTTNLRTPST